MGKDHEHRFPSVPGAFSNGLVYGASKGGVDQLTRAMAEDLSKHWISCNAIASGFFPTELTSYIFNDSERAPGKAAQTAIGLNGELSDLEGITVFLSSSDSEYIKDRPSMLMVVLYSKMKENA